MCPEKWKLAEALDQCLIHHLQYIKLVKTVDVLQEIGHIFFRMEVLCNEGSKDGIRRTAKRSDLMVCILLCLLLNGDCFLGVVVQVDVEMVVVVVAIESSKEHKATADEPS